MGLARRYHDGAGRVDLRRTRFPPRLPRTLAAPACPVYGIPAGRRVGKRTHHGFRTAMRPTRDHRRMRLRLIRPTRCRSSRRVGKRSAPTMGFAQRCGQRATIAGCAFGLSGLRDAGLRVGWVSAAHPPGFRNQRWRRQRAARPACGHRRMRLRLIRPTWLRGGARLSALHSRFICTMPAGSVAPQSGWYQPRATQRRNDDQGHAAGLAARPCLTGLKWM